MSIKYLQVNAIQEAKWNVFLFGGRSEPCWLKRDELCLSEAPVSVLVYTFPVLFPQSVSQFLVWPTSLLLQHLPLFK